MGDRVIKNIAGKGRMGTTSPPARPFQCQWREGCPKSFNRKSDLQRHYRIHTNERPYACDYSPCEKTFIQRSALTVHRRTHTGDKPHKCQFPNCGKCFSDSSSLARHRRIHTNDKPYICKNAQCRKAFCRKTTMTKHFRKEHPTESLDQEEDADFSDLESGDEPSLEHDVDSPSSAEYPNDQGRKGTPTNAAASNYNANLWRLPAQTAQRPQQQGVRLERSLSNSSQRTLPDASLKAQVPNAAYIPRSNTMPTSMARSQSQDMAMWHAQQPLNGPAAGLPPATNFGMHAMHTPTSAPAVQHRPQQLPIRRASVGLQPVHDILLDDPTAYTAPSQIPPPTHVQQQQVSYRDEMPPTPVPRQQLPQFSAPMSEQPIPIETYQVPDIGNQAVFMPQSNQMASLYDSLEAYKELKMEDANWPMPDAALSSWI